MPFMPVRALGAPHTTWTHARAGVDLADAQPVGVGMLHGLDDVADDEALQRLGRVGDAFDLEPEHGQRVAHSASDAVVSRCSFSQESVNFIGPALRSEASRQKP